MARAVIPEQGSDSDPLSQFEVVFGHIDGVQRASSSTDPHRNAPWIGAATLYRKLTSYGLIEGRRVRRKPAIKKR